jgi:hypothetical protein
MPGGGQARRKGGRAQFIDPCACGAYSASRLTGAGSWRSRVLHHAHALFVTRALPSRTR